MVSRTLPLGDISVINPKHEKGTVSETPVSFVSMSDVNSESASVTHEELRTYGETSKGFTQFKKGDILLAKITPCFENGKIAQATISETLGAGSTEFHAIRVREGSADPRFLLHMIRHPKILFNGERKMTGSSGHRRVPESYVANITIPNYPLEIQEKIGRDLDTLESLRSKRRRSIELLDEFTQSIFLDMFGDPVSNTRTWERKKLSDIVTGIDSGKSPKCHNTPAREGKWGVLKLGAVTSCEYLPEENKELPEGESFNPEKEVHPGDLLFTRKNTPELVAACTLVDDTPPNLLFPDLIFRINLKSDAPVTKNYLYRLLTYSTKRRKIQKLAGGSAASMVNISKARLLETEIEIPPMELQKDFDSRIRSAQKLKAKHQAHLTLLDELFASVQQRAFDGTLWEDQDVTA